MRRGPHHELRGGEEDDPSAGGGPPAPAAAGGASPPASALPPSRGELCALSVSALRRALGERRVSCEGCVEKGDLVDALLRSYDAPRGAAGAAVAEPARRPAAACVTSCSPR